MIKDENRYIKEMMTDLEVKCWLLIQSYCSFRLLGYFSFLLLDLDHVSIATMVWHMYLSSLCFLLLTHESIVPSHDFQHLLIVSMASIHPLVQYPISVSTSLEL